MSFVPLVRRIQIRSKTSSEWNAANVLLLKGEIGYESDTHKMKIGDGVNVWSLLPYIVAAGGGGQITYLEFDGGNATTVYADDILRFDMGAAT